MFYAPSLKQSKKKPRSLTKITSWLLVSIIAYAPLCPAYSQESPSPNPIEEALRACDGALEKADLALKDQRSIVGLQSELILRQTRGLEELQTRRDSVWASPILWTTIGILVGAGLVVAGGSIVKEVNR